MGPETGSTVTASATTHSAESGNFPVRAETCQLGVSRAGAKSPRCRDSERDGDVTLDPSESGRHDDYPVRDENRFLDGVRHETTVGPVRCQILSNCSCSRRTKSMYVRSHDLGMLHARIIAHLQRYIHREWNRGSCASMVRCGSSRKKSGTRSVSIASIM